MTLNVRAVQLRTVTDQGALGRLITFQNGLNIVRGANSRGKTQVVQAIIYALGLERMLQARANAPLGSALTSEVFETDADETATPVRQSWVAVEIDNGA